MLYDINSIASLFKDITHEKATIIFGAGLQEELGVSISVIATNYEQSIESITDRAFNYIGETVSKNRNQELFSEIFNSNSSKELELQNYITSQNNDKIFLSYCQKDGVIADEIDDILSKELKHEYDITRDIRDTEYKDSFLEFMNTIPKHNFVLTLISDNYLKSSNCMYEVLECMRNHDFAKRILFIILNDAQVYDRNSITVYTGYWKNQMDDVNENIKENVQIGLIPSLMSLSEEWIRCNKIMVDIKDIIKLLKDEKGYKYDLLKEYRFKPIIDYIRKTAERKKDGNQDTGKLS